MEDRADSLHVEQKRPKHPAFLDLDPSTRFLYIPRTITGLFLGLVLVIYFSRTFNPPAPSSDPVESAQAAYANVKHGLIAVIMVWLGYSFLQGPTTCMVRPHPGLWRLVHGVIVVYLLALVFLLFQNVDDARQLFRHLYPDLGVELPERAYGTDCRLYIPGQGMNWPVIQDTVLDEFVVAHTLGWWAKALVLRNRLLLWTLSIGFELMELTFQHMLPNFNECWWDSWLLDVLICNWLGIFVGMHTVRWFGSREYNWSGLSQQPSLLAKARRSLLQFTPYSWDNFDWRVTSSPSRLLVSLVPVVVFLLFEVNAFFLKYILWIPPRNPLNTYRLILLFFLALPSVKEYYTFIESNESNVFTKLGPFAWLGTAVALAETLICIKFGKGLFPKPWPRRVLLAWGLGLSAFSASFGFWCYRYYIRGYRHGIPHAPYRNPKPLKSA